MTLRCKPGDMAVVCGAGVPEEEQHLGKVIKVVGLTRHSKNGRPCWTYEGPLIKHLFPDGSTTTVRAFGDDILRPLRPDPGFDETLIRAGLPKRNSVTFGPAHVTIRVNP
jgi:hypothetical protein